jgi:hypothetical protein
MDESFVHVPLPGAEEVKPYKIHVSLCFFLSPNGSLCAANSLQLY